MRRQVDTGEEMGVITVTGSRTITDNALSPTPLTTVDIAELAKTTPSDTADALNKLPTILGGRTPRTQGNGSTNNGGNTLSLRNFGPTRTLVLLNGHRVAPNNQDGSVNIDVMPQMTGGAGRHRDRRRFGDLRFGRRRRRSQLHPGQGVHRPVSEG